MRGGARSRGEGRVTGVTYRGHTSKRISPARFGAITLTVVLLAFAALEAFVVLSAVEHPEITVGMDFMLYRHRAAAWLAGDGFYLAHQVAGPYTVSHGDALYPPVALLLFVPFTVLPAVLWWAIPVGVIAAALWRTRPPVWAWPILAAVLVYPRTWIILLYGNPSLWAIALLAAGLAWRWPTAFVALKLTLAPFALLGVRHRLWRIGAAVAIVACLAFAPMWPDFMVAMINVRTGGGYGLEYLLGEWPIALAMVVALWPHRAAEGVRTSWR